MRISKISIENFRSIKKLELALGETTVLIGPNNAGKTSVLDAVRIALTRKWGQRGTGFTEYDIHLPDESADPKTSPGIAIEVRVEETTAGEWSDAIQQDLDDIAQIDPATGLTSVLLRTTCAWNAAEEAYVPTWQFLNAARQPLGGASARRTNLERFWQYLPVFYLGALRDVDDEFSPRSQFWGRLLKAIQIPKALETRVHRVLSTVNSRLLKADPKLGQIADTLTGATKISARDRDGEVGLQLLPLKTWDLLSKAEIILRNEDNLPWLPLKNHGQGVQSLSVLFLFQAFVEHLLNELYEPDSTPVLALEEPETHLHPQAARTLWSHVSGLSGQKLITTHSPYFVQNVPFRDLRILRLTGNGTEVRWLQSSFSASIPNVANLATVVANSGGRLAYDPVTSMLTVKGKLDQHTYRALLTCYGGTPERGVAEPAIRELKERSLVHVSDEDLQSMETFARRIRGEIFFATRWFLVEGQAEHVLVSAMAEALGYSFDTYGVALIDAVNNGNPPVFATLARGLGIPWLAVFDGDAAGQGYKDGILARDFDGTFVDERCRLLPAGHLEQQLIADGIEPELRAILNTLGRPNALTCDLPTLMTHLEKTKTDYAALLAKQIKADPTLAQRILEPVRQAIASLRGLT